LLWNTPIEKKSRISIHRMSSCYRKQALVASVVNIMVKDKQEEHNIRADNLNDKYIQSRCGRQGLYLHGQGLGAMVHSF
jgi:hypothetical protein